MGVVTAPGVYNFSNVLASWAYQRSLGVTPVVELSFMPAVLAGCSWKDPAGNRPGHSPKTVNPGKPPCTHTGMKYKGIQELPTDWNDWYDLVKALAQAAVDAYGVEEIRTWSFECWNVSYYSTENPCAETQPFQLLCCVCMCSSGAVG
jgi:xylan 1,4-beta-xylosidase